MMSDVVARMNWWGAKKKAPRGMDTLPADCRDAASLIEQQAAKIAELEHQLSVMTSSRDGYAKQDAARFVEVRRLALDEAAMVAEDYGDTYSVGRGVARAIRSLKKGEQA